MADLTQEEVWRLLEQVKDPEIPAVSVVELGVVREVRVAEGIVQVELAPTFSGCPALGVMRAEIEAVLEQAGAGAVAVHVNPTAPWSSDQITPEGRRKLRAFGLVPPPVHRGDLELALQEPAACPRCGSVNTTLKNAFGSTLCRAMHVCNECGEPFERLKPI